MDHGIQWAWPCVQALDERRPGMSSFAPHSGWLQNGLSLPGILHLGGSTVRLGSSGQSQCQSDPWDHSLAVMSTYIGMPSSAIIAESFASSRRSSRNHGR